MEEINYSLSTNPFLKRAHIKHQFSDDQLLELKRCLESPLYFFRNHYWVKTADGDEVLFDPYPYQIRILEALLENRLVIGNIGRQLGKSTIIIAFFLYNIIFFENREILLLSKTEEAAKELLVRIKFAYEKIPMWMQQGVVKNDAKTFELENKSKIKVAATTDTAGRSGSYWAVFADEFAFVQANMAQEFYTAALPTISSGKNTKFIIISTPNGMNLFYKLFMDAKKNRNGFVWVDAHWSEHPGRDQAWAEGLIKAMGPEKFNQEFLAEFSGASDTLISSVYLKTMVHDEAIFFQENFHAWEMPIPGHRYVTCVDISEGIGQDYTVVSVIDVTSLPYKMVGKYRDNRTSIMILPFIIKDISSKYNDAYSFIEIGGCSKNVGDQVARTLYYDLQYEYVLCTTFAAGRGGKKIRFAPDGKAELGVKMTQSVKSEGCSNLKHLVETQTLMIPDFEVIEEFSNFKKIGNTFKAEEGNHDDIVMSLVLFGWLSKAVDFETLTSTKVDEGDYLEEHQLLPDPIVFNGLEKDYMVEHGLVWELVDMIPPIGHFHK